MATYKVIQDIEAEDKFLGPLTLKQFIFGASAIFFGYLGVYAVTQGAAFLLTVFAPPTLLGLFLAIPWNKDQPTEVWVLAKLRFRVKPRSRIWDQAGLEELVTITVPKVIEISKTDGLN
ncbi:MAG: PrgI family protein, partial [Candidatus Saccharimonadales bacterium]